MSAAAVPGLTGSAGAVLNVGLLAGFIVNFGFEAFNGTTWVGVDSYFNLLQFTACTNCVGKSVNGGFWSEAPATVPEPESLLFVGSGLLLGARRLRRSRTA